MSSLYKFLLPLKTVILLKKCWNHFAKCEVTSYRYEWNSPLRRGSTLVFFVLQKPVRVFIINRFLIQKNTSPSWNRQMTEIVRRFARLHSRRMELADIPSEWFRNPGNFLREHAPKPTFHAVIINKFCLYYHLQKVCNFQMQVFQITI